MVVTMKWDENEMAFKIAASMAVQDACKRANPVILEPMMKVEVVTPEKFMGDVTGNLSSKRALIEGMEDRGINKVIKAVVPLSDVCRHDRTKVYDRGRASFTMEFLHMTLFLTMLRRLSLLLGNKLWSLSV